MVNNVSVLLGSLNLENIHLTSVKERTFSSPTQLTVQTSLCDQQTLRVFLWFVPVATGSLIIIIMSTTLLPLVKLDMKVCALLWINHFYAFLGPISHCCCVKACRCEDGCVAMWRQACCVVLVKMGVLLCEGGGCISMWRHVCCCAKMILLHEDKRSAVQRYLLQTLRVNKRASSHLDISTKFTSCIILSTCTPGEANTYCCICIIFVMHP